MLDGPLFSTCLRNQMLGLVVKVLRRAGRSRGQTDLIEPQSVDVLAAAHAMKTVLFGCTMTTT